MADVNDADINLDSTLDTTGNSVEVIEGDMIEETNGTIELDSTLDTTDSVEIVEKSNAVKGKRTSSKELNLEDMVVIDTTGSTATEVDTAGSLDSPMPEKDVIPCEETSDSESSKEKDNSISMSKKKKKKKTSNRDSKTKRLKGSEDADGESFLKEDPQSLCAEDDGSTDMSNNKQKKKKSTSDDESKRLKGSEDAENLLAEDDVSTGTTENKHTKKKTCDGKSKRLKGSENADDESSIKEDLGIYPENPFAKDAGLTVTTNKKHKKKTSGSDGKSKRLKGSVDSSEPEVIDVEEFILDVDGDAGNADNECLDPYPVGDVPVYDTNISGVLADIEYNMETGKKVKEDKPKKSCFNCNGDHNVPECPEPQDPQRIAANRKVMMANRVSNVRYHEDCENRFGQFQPGKISESLREALGLTDDELPTHIYRMRCLGYPPGWLKEAEVHQAEMKLFDGTGQLVSHPDAEEGETDATSVKYNPEKLVSFPGFNVSLPMGFRDEYREKNFPVMQKHHRKHEFKRFMELNKAGSYRKRKLKDESLRSNGNTDKGSEDVDDSGINLSAEMDETLTTPLPEEVSASPKPVPEEVSASSKPKLKGKEDEEDGEIVEEDSRSSIGYLEAKRETLLDQLGGPNSSISDSTLESVTDEKAKSSENNSTLESVADEKAKLSENDSTLESVTNEKAKSSENNSTLESVADEKAKLSENDSTLESVADEKAKLSENDSTLESVADEKAKSSENETTTEANSSQNDDSNSSNSTDIKKTKGKHKHQRSESKSIKLGAAIPASITPYATLPDAEKWTVDVTDHINFENLPDALGTWEKMKGLVQRVRKHMETLHPDDE